MIPEFGYISEIESGKRDNYELFLATPSQVYFELFECFGRLTIKGSETFDDLESEKYNIN